MIAEDDDIYTFMKICEDFVNSTKELRDAAALCDEDPIKQDMIAFIVPEFHKMWARSEGIKVFLENILIIGRLFWKKCKLLPNIIWKWQKRLEKSLVLYIETIN